MIRVVEGKEDLSLAGLLHRTARDVFNHSYPSNTRYRILVATFEGEADITTLIRRVVSWASGTVPARSLICGRGRVQSPTSSYVTSVYRDSIVGLVCCSMRPSFSTGASADVA